MHALEAVQYVVSYQWNELTLSAKSDVVDIAKSLICAIAGPLKAPILTFLHKLFTQAGARLCRDLIPLLITVSGKGPVEAEIACSIMKWLPTEYGTQADQKYSKSSVFIRTGRSEDTQDVGVVKAEPTLTVTKSGEKVEMASEKEKQDKQSETDNMNDE